MVSEAEKNKSRHEGKECWGRGVATLSRVVRDVFLQKAH